jgi:hypothetical protein
VGRDTKDETREDNYRSTLRPLESDKLSSGPRLTTHAVSICVEVEKRNSQEWKQARQLPMIPFVAPLLLC